MSTQLVRVWPLLGQNAPMRTPADAVDRILVSEAAAARTRWRADEVVVLDDQTGALSAAVADHLVRPDSGALRVWSDSLLAERAVREALAQASTAADFPSDLGPALFGGAQVVIIRLPKALSALDEMAEAAAAYADDNVQVLAGGRVKHMSRGMNSVLGAHFAAVSASLGREKARVLRASDIIARAPSSYPRSEFHAELGLTVCARGGAFAGTKIDLGTRTLLGCLDQLPAGPICVVDLGCGTGVLSAMVAHSHPLAKVIAIDESWSACQSTHATATAQGVADRIEIIRGDVMSVVANDSVDVVLCNPPFHRGTTRDSDEAFRMFADSARVLRPGGELWTVFNTHLPYRSVLRRLVGETVIVAQTPKFMVTRSRWF